MAAARFLWSQAWKPALWASASDLNQTSALVREKYGDFSVWKSFEDSLALTVKSAEGAEPSVAGLPELGP